MAYSDKHRMYKSKYYNLWCNIKARCNRKTAPNYERYGGRGIKMQKNFNDDFVLFYSYIKELDNFGVNGYTLDRADNDRGYEEGNLRWVDVSVQATNKRVRKNNNTGYSGIFYLSKSNKYEAAVTVNYKKIFIGNYSDINEAVLSRNNYISANKLPHKLQ